MSAGDAGLMSVPLSDDDRRRGSEAESLPQRAHVVGRHLPQEVHIGLCHRGKIDRLLDRLYLRYVELRLILHPQHHRRVGPAHHRHPYETAGHYAPLQLLRNRIGHGIPELQRYYHVYEPHIMPCGFVS